MSTYLKMEDGMRLFGKVFFGFVLFYLFNF